MNKFSFVSWFLGIFSPMNNKNEQKTNEQTKSTKTRDNNRKGEGGVKKKITYFKEDYHHDGSLGAAYEAKEANQGTKLQMCNS